MITFEFCTCFGLSIEANEDNIYALNGDNDETVLVQFEGVIINLPFLKIHIGTLYALE